MNSTQTKLFPIGPEESAPYSAFRDSSFWMVIASNILALFLALTQNWNLGEILWIYWFQSVAIGATNAWRMFTLKEFSTDGLTANDVPVPETRGGQVSTAAFFVVHYGFFHLIYAVFLFADHPLDIVSSGRELWLLAAGAFALSHIYSLWRNMSRDFRDRKPNLGALMAYPYMRIIPMHLTIICGTTLGSGAMALFMILKTFADAGMHAAEHHIFQAASKPAP